MRRSAHAQGTLPCCRRSGNHGVRGTVQGLALGVGTVSETEALGHQAQAFKRADAKE